DRGDVSGVCGGAGGEAVAEVEAGPHGGAVNLGVAAPRTILRQERPSSGRGIAAKNSIHCKARQRRAPACKDSQVIWRSGGASPTLTSGVQYAPMPSSTGSESFIQLAGSQENILESILDAFRCQCLAAQRRMHFQCVDDRIDERLLQVRRVGELLLGVGCRLLRQGRVLQQLALD